MTGPAGAVDQVHVHLDWKGPGTRPGLPSDKDLCAKPNTPPCGASNAPYSTPLGPVDNNGPYHVAVTGSGHDIFSSYTFTVNADFALAIPPKTPAGLKATANKDRTVTLVWDRNGEADLFYYDLARKGPGDKDFKPLPALAQPPPDEKPKVIDNTVPLAAGDYQYQVAAVRYGQ